MNIFKPVFISYSLESMQLKELADELKRYLNQYPDMADKEIYWMQLDIAATKDNIGIDNRDWMLFISNGIFGAWPQQT